jgi:LacI family transcriptional regulator
LETDTPKRRKRRHFREGHERAATIDDVARHAGVSPATVSRVLNHPEQVSLELHARIQGSLRTLNFVPHGGARALAFSRSLSIGVVVPTLGMDIFAGFVQALQARLAESGYQVIVGSSEYTLDREFEHARNLIERRVDGLVLVGHTHQQALYDLLRVSRIPFVNVFSTNTEPDRPSIGIDNFEGSYLMIQHLIELGHRRFALLTSPVANNDRMVSRIAGARQCLADHGLPLPPGYLLEVPYALGEGRNGLRGVMDVAPETTALMCTTDILAIGALQEAIEMGIDVPGRLSITGFDDLEFASHVHPNLTTVHVPFREIGRRTAGLLLSRIEGRPTSLHVKLEADIVVRGSTAPPAS